MTTDIQFRRGAPKRPTEHLVRVQWASGLPTTTRQLHTGWLIQQGQDDTLDTLLDAADQERITIRHGGGNIVTHWTFPVLSFFVICDGVQGLADIRGISERYGIALGWGTTPEGRDESRLEFQAFAQELLALGWDQPVLFGCRSTATGDVLAALDTQFRVLKQTKRPVPFYAFSLPIGAGEPVMRGKNAQKEITPMVSLVPEEVGREYLVAHYITATLAEQIEDRADAVVAWSVQRSAAFGAAEQAQDVAGDVDPAAAPSHAAAPAAAAPAGRGKATPETSFYAVWGKAIGGHTWSHVCRYLGWPASTEQPDPTDRREWLEIGDMVGRQRNKEEIARKRARS